MAKLTTEEKYFIKRNEIIIQNFKESIKTVESTSIFKEGDYLVAFEAPSRWNEGQKTPIKNSYGGVKKYQVIAIDSNNLPYMKELNKNGVPYGPLITPIDWRGDGKLELNFIFEVDPDYEDAIILDDQANYKAAGALKERSDKFKEIAAFNKSVRVKCKTTSDLVNFIARLQVGHTLWRSTNSFLVIQQIDPIPCNTIGHVTHDKPFIKVVDHKGKLKDLSFRDLKYMAIYTQCPRTYNELKNPN